MTTSVAERIAIIAFAYCAALVAIALTASLTVALLTAALDDWQTFRRARRIRRRAK